MQPRLIPVILAGGSGERLWPLSTQDYPKQFVSFDRSGESLFQQTVERVKDRQLFGSPIIVCNDLHRFIVTEQLAALSCHNASIIVEPHARNTGPALLLAAIHAQAMDPDALLLVLPSDHRIEHTTAFYEAVRQAAAAANDGWFITFACTPTAPETGYGYIQAGDALPEHPTVHRIASFTEKPARDIAEAYLAKGNYGWNSGMFLMQATAVIVEFKSLAPALFATCQAAYTAHTVDLGFVRPDAQMMAACPSISIDYALMEKTQRGAVIPLEMGWNDLGSWNMLHHVSGKDSAGNSIQGFGIAIDTQDCYIHSPNTRVATIGLRDMVVIAANDTVLVAPKDRLDELKPILQIIRETTPTDAPRHESSHRPWGRFHRVDYGSHYQVKKLHLKPGGKISLQSHAHRAEHWVVVEGRATVTNGEQRYVLEQNQSTFIAAGTVHRLENCEATPLVVIEIQTGESLDETDITRVEDAYNRS